MLGLRVVGCIYTDLETDPQLQPPNNVKHTRFISEDNTVFMGAEILNAAVQQMKHPNAVHRKYSLDGVYGSKFVTCVVSGGSDNAIQLQAYQATNDTVAMMRADILRPSATSVNEVRMGSFVEVLVVGRVRIPNHPLCHTHQFGVDRLFRKGPCCC